MRISQNEAVSRKVIYGQLSYSSNNSNPDDVDTSQLSQCTFSSLSFFSVDWQPTEETRKKEEVNDIQWSRREIVTVLQAGLLPEISL